jgi:hypothetical protein
MKTVYGLTFDETKQRKVAAKLKITRGNSGSRSQKRYSFYCEVFYNALDLEPENGSFFDPIRLDKFFHQITAIGHVLREHKDDYLTILEQNLLLEHADFVLINLAFALKQMRQFHSDIVERGGAVFEVAKNLKREQIIHVGKKEVHEICYVEWKKGYDGQVWGNTWEYITSLNCAKLLWNFMELTENIDHPLNKFGYVNFRSHVEGQHAIGLDPSEIKAGYARKENIDLDAMTENGETIVITDTILGATKP